MIKFEVIGVFLNGSLSGHGLVGDFLEGCGFGSMMRLMLGRSLTIERFDVWDGGILGILECLVLLVGGLVLLVVGLVLLVVRGYGGSVGGS